MKFKISVQVVWLKTMILVCLMVLGMRQGALSQASNYTFATANVGYVPITGGTVRGTASNDDESFDGIPIGFTFNYNCNNYTQFSLAANGFIVLDWTAPPSIVPISGGSGNNVISALGMNLQGNGTTSELRTELIGTAPNRTMIIQWKDYRSFGSTGDVYNFQIRLNETANTIDLHYNAFTQDATNRTPQVGLRGASSADFNNRSVAGGGSWAASTAGGANTATCALQTATKPANGQRFRFSPTSMAYGSATAVDNAPGGTALICEQNCPITRVEVVMNGNCTQQLSMTQLVVVLTGTAPLSSISRVHLYYAGTSALVSAPRTEIVPGGKAPAASLTFDGNVQLSSGTNYFWITMDFNGTGTVGNTVGADMPNTNSLTVDGTLRNPTATPNCLRTFAACSAYPTNPTLWMRASLGTSTTTNNVVVSSWASSGGSIPITLPQANASKRPTYKNGAGNTTLNRFNYNPFLLFDGANDQLITAGTYDFGNGTSAGAGLSTFAVMGWTSGVVAYEWNGPNATTKTKGDASCVITNGSGELGSNNHALYPTAFQATVTDCIGKENGIEARCNALGQALRSNNNPSFVTDLVAIGSNVNSGEFMNGGAAEWLIFNSMLSSTSRLEIESYLAVKYGVTLGTNALPTNYLASNGTITYFGDNTYQNNIIGIGRDATANLLQKQSHNYDDSVRIYKGPLVATNIANTSTFAVDNSFVIVGANTGAMCSTGATISEMPSACGLFSRLDREWKVTRTNMAEDFNMDFTLNSCATPGAVSVADLRLLVDDDGNFANGVTSCYRNGDGSGIVITYNNPVITVSNINTATHIPNNSTRYITIASVTASTSLPVTLLNFEGLCKSGTVQLRWKTAPKSDEDYFVVERSQDALTFAALARIEGLTHLVTTQNYVYSDEEYDPVVSYYRLRQVSLGGSTVHSEILEVDRASCGAPRDFVLYPNPSIGDLLHLSGNADVDQNGILRIQNLLGQEFATIPVIFQMGGFTVDLPIDRLTPGLYLLRIEAGGRVVQNIKFVRQ
jgi:N-terminal domain of BNR-repeat neuraminidase